MRILSNVTFLFVSLSYTAESAIVTAFITFIPKFIESQFGIPASSASIYTGELSSLLERLGGAGGAGISCLAQTGMQNIPALFPACSAAIQRVHLSPENIHNKRKCCSSNKGGIRDPELDHTHTHMHTSTHTHHLNSSI